MIKVKPANITIIEGLFILGHDPLKHKLNYKIFIDADEKVKFGRRLKRDKEERGMSESEIHYQWNNHVLPAYKKHLLPYKESSNVVVANNTNFEEGFTRVKAHFEGILKMRS